MLQKIKSWFKRRSYVYPYQLQMLTSAVERRFSKLEEENARLRNGILDIQADINITLSSQNSRIDRYENYLLSQLCLVNDNLKLMESATDGAIRKRKRSPSATKK